MMNLSLFGVALIAVFGLSIVMASTANATEFLLAEWLNAGAKIAVAQPSDTESSELELVSLNVGNLELVARILCSAILDGTVGPVSEGTVTELLTLTNVAIPTTVLFAAGLSCTNDENCTEPLVWAADLPWKTELELWVNGTETGFTNLLLNPGYYVECLVLGVSLSETCVFESIAISTVNEAGGVVDQLFSENFQVAQGLKLGNCSLAGTELAEINGLGTLLLTAGTALTASSE